MPQTTDIEYVDGEISVPESEPSTIAELTEMVGEQAVVENVNSNLRYRNKYPRVYKKTSAALVAAGYTRAQKIGKDGQPVVKTAKDGSTTPVLVDPIEHIRQVIALGDEGKKVAADTLLPIAQSEPLFVQGERTGGGGKIAQWAEEAANAKFAAGDDAVEAAATVIEQTVPGYKLARSADGEVTPDSLARGISALKRHFDAEAKNKAKAMLG